MSETTRRMRAAMRASVPVAGLALLAAAPTQAANTPRHVGGVGTGLPPATTAPDLASVSVDPGNDLNDGLGERARFCFDANIATVGSGFVLMSYDARRYWTGTGNRATDDEKCVVVTFKAGSDIAQATVGQVGASAVSDVAGKGNIVASEPVQGSAARPAPGRTTGPDLVDVQVDTQDSENKRVKYVFDESLNPDPTRPDGPDADDPPAPESAYQASDFGYVLQDGAPVFAPAGNVQASGTSVTINFKSAPIENAVRFVTQPAATEDRPQSAVLAGSGLPTVTRSSPGVIVKSQTTGGRPDLLKAEPSGPNSYRLTYSTGVTAGPPARFQAIADDGLVSAAAVSTGTGGTQDSITVQFPDSEALTKDPGSIVRILSADGAVINSTDGTKSSIYAQAATSQPNDTAGFTNGPDLLAVAVDPATQRAVFSYDEPVGPSSPSSGFVGFRSDTTSGTGTGGTASSAGTVTVTMGAGITDYVAFGQGYNTVTDTIGRPNPNQSVSKDLQTAPAPPPPAPTPSPSAGKAKFTTGFASFRRSSSRSARVSGRLSSAAKTCRFNRRVILRKVGKGKTRYGTAFSRSDGTFTIKRSRRLSGRIYAVVTEKSTSTTFCRTRQSKKIR